MKTERKMMKKSKYGYNFKKNHFIGYTYDERYYVEKFVLEDFKIINEGCNKTLRTPLKLLKLIGNGKFIKKAVDGKLTQKDLSKIKQMSIKGEI